MILVVRWNETDETKIFGNFKSEELAKIFLSTMRIRRDQAHPVEALICEPNSCPGRKRYEVGLRYVKGVWK